jgi:AcrR family transcriptional regulator
VYIVQTTSGEQASGSANDLLRVGVAEHRLRADARRNRELVLAAARDAFIDQGVEAPLDVIARRAGVGIATLYRRFPTREALMHAVVLDLLARSADEARAAHREEADPYRALARYMHRAIDLRISAVFPAIVGSVPLDSDDIWRARQESAGALQQLIDAAQAAGDLRGDVAFGDIGLLLVRLSRPLPGSFSADLDAGLAHRHLDVVLDGLRAELSPRSPGGLSGPRLELADLQDVGRRRPLIRHAKSRSADDG